MRKRMALMLLGCAMLWGCCADVRAQIGFAEVNSPRVNVRSEPEGRVLFRVDEPQSVFVFEEKVQDGVLWCHVTINHGKNTVSAWIRNDVLRFLGEEFEGVVSVQAGNHYVTGLRADGTVAIMGNDMAHLPCVDTVRTWRNMEQVSSWICEVYGLDGNGVLHAVGRNAWIDGIEMAGLEGKMPMPIADDGTLDLNILAPVIGERTTPDWLQPHENEPVRRVVGRDYMPEAVLTQEGRIYASGEFMPGGSDAAGAGGCRDIDLFWNYLLILWDDGRVEIAPSTHALAQEVSTWRQIAQIAAGKHHALGLSADGTVCYAGDDASHAAQVSAWTDVVDIAAGPGYSIALKADGTVVMAGKYEGYER